MCVCWCCFLLRRARFLPVLDKSAIFTPFSPDIRKGALAKLSVAVKTNRWRWDKAKPSSILLSVTSFIWCPLHLETHQMMIWLPDLLPILKTLPLIAWTIPLLRAILLSLFWDQTLKLTILKLDGTWYLTPLSKLNHSLSYFLWTLIMIHLNANPPSCSNLSRNLNISWGRTSTSVRFITPAPSASVATKPI